MKDKKTTVSGIVGIVIAVVWAACKVFDIDIPAFPEDIAGAIGIAIASIGNLKSKDAD